MTPLATYAERLAALHGQEAQAKWARGDTLLACEREHGDEWTTLADDPRAPSHQVLVSERRTSLAFPAARRRGGLSWSHHWRTLRVTVEGEDGELDVDATAGARDQLLEQAELREWSAHELDTEITRRKEEGEDEEPPTDPHDLERIPYIVARCRELHTRVSDGTVSDVLVADHEWREARERLPFDEQPEEEEWDETIPEEGEVPF